MKIIGAANDPILARDEAAGADRDVGEFEGLDDLLCLIRPDIDMAWGSSGHGREGEEEGLGDI